MRVHVCVNKTPGVTRDSITVPWEYKGHRIEIIDTAGMVHSFPPFHPPLPLALHCTSAASLLHILLSFHFLSSLSGQRRAPRVFDEIEQWSVQSALKAIEVCHVAVLVVDGSQSDGMGLPGFGVLSKQDLLIADKACPFERPKEAVCCCYLSRGWGLGRRSRKGGR